MSDKKNIYVSKWLLKWGRRVHDYPNFWRGCGNFESWALKDQIKDINIKQPIYICGLARAGSTILLEILNEHPDTKSFCYADFPFVHTPWFWSVKSKMDVSPPPLIERAHQDRIMINAQSPEALEELLWMNFDALSHSPSVSHLKTQLDDPFKNYYANTIKKLLYAYNASRYLSKGNYNVSRIQALLDMFPEAKIIIPIRNPINHVASLLKQHRLLINAQIKEPNIDVHLSQMGHFEFGEQRLASNCGNPKDSLAINALFKAQENIRAYARQWAVTYAYVHQLLQNSAIASALHIVRYEDLCNHSSAELEKLAKFCLLDDFSSTIKKYANKLSLPDYYSLDFSEAELTIIADEAMGVASHYGY